MLSKFKTIVVFLVSGSEVVSSLDDYAVYLAAGVKYVLVYFSLSDLVSVVIIDFYYSLFVYLYVHTWCFLLVFLVRCWFILEVFIIRLACFITVRY